MKKILDVIANVLTGIILFCAAMAAGMILLVACIIAVFRSNEV